jgi:hypothetical protein
LTYNATTITSLTSSPSSNIEEWTEVDDGLRQAFGDRRRVFVDLKVKALLLGKTTAAGFPSVECRALLGRFLNGHCLWYSMLGPYNSKLQERPDIERLTGVQETWVLCARRPRPGWRFFGRFAAKDVLVILSARDKRDVSRQTDLLAAAEELAARWNAVFGTHEYVGKEAFNEYYSGHSRDIHAPKA